MIGKVQIGPEISLYWHIWLQLCIVLVMKSGIFSSDRNTLWKFDLKMSVVETVALHKSVDTVLISQLEF